MVTTRQVLTSSALFVGGLAVGFGVAQVVPTTEAEPEAAAEEAPITAEELAELEALLAPDAPPAAPPPSEEPLPPAEIAPVGTVFEEDFSTPASMERFDVGIYHRDDFLIGMASWPGDHIANGEDDSCTLPEEKRTIERGDRESGFNDDWVYRCAPMGDAGLAHLMTSIGDTSGYSIGSFSPRQAFTDISEVRWDVNLTDIGIRQFPEVKIMPVDAFDFQQMPCTNESLPCNTPTHGELGSIGTTFFNHKPAINTGSGRVVLGPTWDQTDPALTSIRERRTHVLRDNGDGTLTFEIEQADGTFASYTADGSFPDGPVRVVFSDHNYTPTKDAKATTFTWHWDDIVIS